MRYQNPCWRALATLIALSALCGGVATAFESESAVPLTIDTGLSRLSMHDLAIRLHGRDVTVSTEFHNDEKTPQAVAFYAYTPLFRPTGVAEDNLDKSFSDLRVLVGHQPKKVTRRRRAFFLGTDITDRLVKAGVDPMPALDPPYKKLARVPAVDGVKPENWDAAIIYSWTDKLDPGERSQHDIHYQDLPEFGPEEISSDRFAQRIRQHCGDPDAARRRIKEVYPDAEYVTVERHEIAVPYMAMQEVAFDVSQPERNWFHGHPLMSLVCGIENPRLQADIKGVLRSADRTIDVMTISVVK